jgi:hypothetical protein
MSGYQINNIPNFSIISPPQPTYEINPQIMYATFECTGIGGGQYNMLIKPMNQPGPLIEFQVGQIGFPTIEITAIASSPIKRIVGMMNFEYNCRNYQTAPNNWTFELYVPGGSLPPTYFGSFSLMMSNTDLATNRL